MSLSFVLSSITLRAFSADKSVQTPTREDFLSPLEITIVAAVSQHREIDVHSSHRYTRLHIGRGHSEDMLGKGASVLKIDVIIVGGSKWHFLRLESLSVND